MSFVSAISANLYRNFVPFGFVLVAPMKENWSWRKMVVKGKWKETYIYTNECTPVERWCVTVENAFNNDSRVYIYISDTAHPHRQMLKFAGYYCSNIWDSALSIIYANFREFTNSIARASGEIKFSNHIYVFTVEKCCFMFVRATRAIRVRRDIVLCIYICIHINCNNECIFEISIIYWKKSVENFLLFRSYLFFYFLYNTNSKSHLSQI